MDTELNKNLPQAQEVKKQQSLESLKSRLADLEEQYYQGAGLARTQFLEKEEKEKHLERKAKIKKIILQSDREAATAGRKALKHLLETEKD